MGINLLNEMDLSKELDPNLKTYDELPYQHVFFDGASINVTYRGFDGHTHTYDVPLSRCTTAGECLDWIHQLHVKTWMTTEMMREFIDVLLNNIPAELWSGGGAK